MKRIVIGIAVVVVVFVGAVLLAVRTGDQPVGDPTRSGFNFLGELFSPRTLRGADARAGGATCVDGDSLTLRRNETCSFTVSADVQSDDVQGDDLQGDDVRRIDFRRTAGSGRVIVEANPGGDGLRQRIDTATPGSHTDDPDLYQMPVLVDPTVVTVLCLGPAPCRLQLER
jgi:hypothetical protein